MVALLVLEYHNRIFFYKLMQDSLQVELIYNNNGIINNEPTNYFSQSSYKWRNKI